MRAQEGPFAAVPLHFKLVLPPTYPSDAPLVLLYTPLPHPNVVPASVQGHRYAGTLVWPSSQRKGPLFVLSATTCPVPEARTCLHPVSKGCSSDPTSNP